MIGRVAVADMAVRMAMIVRVVVTMVMRVIVMVVLMGHGACE